MPSSTPALYVSPVGPTQQVPTSILQATPVSLSTLPNASVQAVPNLPGGQATTLVPAVNTKPSSPAPNRQPPAPPAGSPSGPPPGSPSGPQSPTGNVQQGVSPQEKEPRTVKISQPVPPEGDIQARILFLTEEWIVGEAEALEAAKNGGPFYYSSLIEATELEIEEFFQKFFAEEGQRYGKIEPNIKNNATKAQDGWKFVQEIDDVVDPSFKIITTYEYRWPIFKQDRGSTAANFTKKILKKIKVPSSGVKSEERIFTQNFHILVKI